MIRFILFCLIGAASLNAAPNSVFWTNCTTEVFATGTGHLDEDIYMTVFNRRGHGSTLPPDTGLEWGVFTMGDWSAEAGVDYLGGTDDPLFFNFGIGVGEGKLFTHAPSFKIGIFNVGTRTKGSERTNQNVADFILGKNTALGNLYVGGFVGSHAMGRDNVGFMLGYQRWFCPAKSCEGEDYHKWQFCMDYASGKNTIGGISAAMGYYFTPEISLFNGPVWFNSKKLNGNWKWSVQLSIDFPFIDSGSSKVSPAK